MEPVNSVAPVMQTAMPEVGKPAPLFEVTDQDGKTIKLADLKGKKVVLYFYPKDDTPSCTAQACNLRDNYDDLISKGYIVLGVSSNNEKSHIKFKKKYNLPFPLIADTELVLHQLYGTWGEKQLYGRHYMGTLRTTFIIDEQGFISEIIDKVVTKEHTSQILK